MATYTFSRRQLLLGVALASAGRSGMAAPATLPSSGALANDLASALGKGSPLLVMVSLEGCPYCKQVRENYLGPMREREGLPVVQIDMRSKIAIRDFRGAVSTQDELIRQWGVKVAPTVLFFGPSGVEIAERLVGGYIPDFYGAYLDDRLRMARAVIAK